MASRQAPPPGLPAETRFLPAGECAVVVELGNAIDPGLSSRVLALDRALTERPFAGYVEAIPSYRSLLVFFDPLRATLPSIREHMRRLVLDGDGSTETGAGIKSVPTVYDGEDLSEVARLIGASSEEVVALHSGREYLVYMVGFTPGFAYMGKTDERLALPRRAAPRTRVPPGSVAVAMGQTGIYPSPTPGGWHLLGRAEHRTLFDLDRDPPSFFLPGDRVRFEPVTSLPELPGRATRTTARGRKDVDVLDGGLFTTVQDQGRSGYQRYGVPVAGAVDGAALRAANLLVGNAPGAAGLECTVHGPALRVHRPLVAALFGGDLGAVVERSDLGRWRVPLETSFLLREGNVLRFEGRRSGARAYLAFAGGIDVPRVLDSRSTYVIGGFGGIDGRRLEAGDVLAVGAAGSLRPSGRRWPSAAPEADRDVRDGAVSIRVVLGPQDDHFTEAALAAFAASTYRVAPSSDRMGYRLEGPTLEHVGPREIVSDGMMLGGIQVPPNGLPIVMLADRATMGGYPKIATVTASDLPRFAQLLPGDPVRFRFVSLDEARTAFVDSVDDERRRALRLG
jgi:antagonist of KipI